MLIDGNRFKPYRDLRHLCVVGGDAKYQAIAAASILAKTTRDLMMEEYDLQYPVYHWRKNKGYPTPEHKLAIAEHGSNLEVAGNHGHAVVRVGRVARRQHVVIGSNVFVATRAAVGLKELK